MSRPALRHVQPTPRPLEVAGPPDVYVDGVDAAINQYGCTLTGLRTVPHGGSGAYEPVYEGVVRLRFSAAMAREIVDVLTEALAYSAEAATKEPQ